MTQDQPVKSGQTEASKTCEGSTKFPLLAWLWRHPLLIVLLANCLFFAGSWNSQDGFGEDTAPVLTAMQNIREHRLSGNLYIDTLTFFLTAISPDPVNACTLMRMLTSVLSSVGVYLVLSCFSKYLGRGAILFATFAWTASCLNAPVIQSTSLSAFTFGITVIGVYFLLRLWSVTGAIVFYLCCLTAASMRPEYTAPAVLVTGLFFVIGLLKATTFLEHAFGIPRWRSRLVCVLVPAIVVMIMLIRPSHKMRDKMQYADSYMLFGFSQCYAAFYQREHPEKIFSPMTEYAWLMKRDFGDPKRFVDALRNNPRGAARYFFCNSLENVKNIPRGLLIVRDYGLGRFDKPLYNLMVKVLLAGGLLGLWRFYRRCSELGVEKKVRGWRTVDAFFREDPLLGWRLLVLVLLACASSVSIFLLVGSPRYWITMVPGLYLALAFTMDSLLRMLKLTRFEPLVVALSLIAFCSPNFILPQPNYEYRAVQHIAPLLKKHPVIGAWWARPDCVFGLNDDAKDISINNGIKTEDIAAGKFDVLMIDDNFRHTDTWVQQHVFFEDLENDPAKYGFKKVDDMPTGRFDVLYRPKP